MVIIVMAFIITRIVKTYLEEWCEDIRNIIEGNHQRFSTAINTFSKEYFSFCGFIFFPTWSQWQIASLAFRNIIFTDSSHRHHPEKLVNVVFTVGRENDLGYTKGKKTY